MLGVSSIECRVPVCQCFLSHGSAPIPPLLLPCPLLFPLLVLCFLIYTSASAEDQEPLEVGFGRPQSPSHLTQTGSGELVAPIYIFCVNSPGGRFQVILSIAGQARVSECFRSKGPAWLAGTLNVCFFVFLSYEKQAD